MKTPPFLLGAVLVFWGWQTGFLIPGVLMGLILEGAHLVETRWDFSDEDFARMWSFCTLLVVAAMVYAFTSNEGSADLRGFLHSPSMLTQRNAGLATARTAFSVLRWLPMLLFMFTAAQAYSIRDAVPLRVTSLILARRWKQAMKLGLPAPLSRTFNISYPYFVICLFATCFHSAENTSFFWGFCALSAWALWPHRSPRFGLALWLSAVLAVTGLSYFGQRGMGQLQSYLGNLNPQWFTGFMRRRFDPIQSQTEIGQLGRIKTSAKIVIRLEAKNGVPPRRLRETTYRSFKGRIWYADLTENDFSHVAETKKATFQLLDKPTSEVVNISCYLPGGKALLPLPESTARLEHLLAYTVKRSSLGGVLEEGPGLVVFDALYGGTSATIDEPPDDGDLLLPGRETNTLEQIVANLHLRGQNFSQALEALGRFFSTQFTYTTWLDQPRFPHKNDTPLSRFLLRTRSGHCEYFATAGVLLLRSAGIPARYAVGYAVHEGSGQNYVVRQRDAHAWCLVWDERHRAWRDFDPTPATWVSADALDSSWTQKLSDVWGRIAFEISKFRWGQSHLRQYFLWALVPVLALLLYQIIFRKRLRLWGRKGAKSSPAAVWPGFDSEFYELERSLAKRGLERRPSEPLSTWLRRVSGDEALTQLRTPLRELLALHYRYRFDPRGLNSGERQTLRTLSNTCLATLDQLRSEMVAG
jgi:transglutaminase-like putative cysteine protease